MFNVEEIRGGEQERVQTEKRVERGGASRPMSEIVDVLNLC